MSGRAERIAVAMTVATVASAWLISQAQGTPKATAAKGGNSITASATVDASYDPYEPTAAIKGQIRAIGHKFGPRHCLRDREVWAYYTGVGGQTLSTDADNPTDKKGRFTLRRSTSTTAAADNNAAVPPSGGTVTFTLMPSTAHAPKKRGDILDSFNCPPVSTTVSVQVPPEPPTD